MDLQIFLNCTVTLQLTSDTSWQTGAYGSLTFSLDLSVALTWLPRPLPQAMLYYVRADTHFLLYIYDNLRNALLDRVAADAPTPLESSGPEHIPSHAFVREVLSRSEETALRVYEKQVYDIDTGSGPGGWDTLAKKWNKSPFTAAAGSEAGEQKEVYKVVHAWRDRVAREEDESIGYAFHHFSLGTLQDLDCFPFKDTSFQTNTYSSSPNGHLQI